MTFPRGRRSTEMLAFIVGLALARSALTEGQSCAEDAGEGCSAALGGDAVGLLQHSARSPISGPGHKGPQSQQDPQQVNQKPVQPSQKELDEVVKAFPKDEVGSDETWRQALELAGLELEVQTVENSKIASQMPYATTGDTDVPSGFHGIFWLDQWHTSSVCTKEYNRQRPFPHTPSQETLVSFGDKGTDYDSESGCLGPVPGYGGFRPHWTFTNNANGRFQLGGSMSSRITANFCFEDDTQQDLDVVAAVLAGDQWLPLPTWLGRMRMERTSYGWNRITTWGPNVSQTLNKYGKFLKYGQGVLQTFFDILNVGDTGSMQYPVIQVVDGDGQKTKYWDEYMKYVSGPGNDHKDTQLSGVFTPQFTPRYQQKCFGYTGHLCGEKERPCPEDSSSICQRGKCVCKAGCAGTDGKCHAEENSVVASRFNLRNGRWPEYHLYVKEVSMFQQIGLTDHPGAEAKWSLYEMPSREGGNGYILGSDKLANNETIGMVSPTYGLILRLEPQAFFAQGLPEADRKNLGPHEVSLTVCSLRSKNRPGTVLIGGGEPMAWVLGKSMSSEAFAHENTEDLDDSSHWLTDPPIPESKLEPCKGVRTQGQSAKR